MNVVKHASEEVPEFNLVLPELVGEFKKDVLELYETSSLESDVSPFLSYEWFATNGAIDLFCQLVAKYFYSMIAENRGYDKDHDKWTEEQQEDVGMDFTSHYTWFENLFIDDMIYVLDSFSMTYVTHGPYPEEFTIENKPLKGVW